MRWLKQSTAASLAIGPFLDESDGVTSKESFTAGSLVAYKNLAASVAANPTITHVASGMYAIELASGSADTLGLLRLHFANSSSHLPVWEDFLVVPANTYDSLVSGTDDVDAQIAGSGIAASTFAAGAIDSTAIGAGALSVGKLGASAIGASNIGASALTIDVIASTGATKIADHTLRREWGDAASSTDAGTTSACFRSLLGATAKQVNKLDITSGSLQIFAADDDTVLGTQGVTACAAASPIVTLDTS